ncbi:MAG: hypothetical protein H6Q87_1369, partial [candidate division NC10 bacterium]|nr:hypothetical protein [candidate division NC10 bacterium]
MNTDHPTQKPQRRFQDPGELDPR